MSQVVVQAAGTVMGGITLYLLGVIGGVIRAHAAQAEGAALLLGGMLTVFVLEIRRVRVRPSSRQWTVTGLLFGCLTAGMLTLLGT